MQPAAARPIFVIRLRPAPEIDGVRALRALLKRAKRQFGLICLDAKEEFGMPNKENTLSAALALAAHGLAVLPLHYPVRTAAGLVCSCGHSDCKPAKHPFAWLAPNGIKGATTDPAQIEACFHAYPRINIGVAAAGLLILDVDPRHGGYESLAELEEANDIIPHTWVVCTGSNGRHIYMELPADTKVNNSAGKLGRGLDIRTDGGYVVAPPSLHINGMAYRWLFAPDEAPLAEAPAWLIEKLKPPPQSPRPARTYTSRVHIRAVAGVLDAVASAREGERNNITFWAACRAGEMIAAGWLTPDAAIDVLLEAALKAGLPEHRAMATIRSGLRTTGNLEPCSIPSRYETGWPKAPGQTTRPRI